MPGRGAPGSQPLVEDAGITVTTTGREPTVPATAPANQATPTVGRSPILVEVSWVVFLVFVYDWVQDLVPLRRALAFRNGRAIFSAEVRIGLDPELAMDHWLAHQNVLAYVASNFYAVAIFAVTFALAAYTWWRRPDIYVALRNDLVLANLIGFAVFLAFPVAPPRMLGRFIDIVAQAGGLGWHNDLVRHADQLAAMPSMHLGYAAWCSLVAWRLARRRASKFVAVLFGVAYPLLTAVVVMATGNHYLFDVLAGVATTAVSVVAVEVLPGQLRRLRRRTVAMADLSPRWRSLVAGETVRRAGPGGELNWDRAVPGTERRPALKAVAQPGAGIPGPAGGGALPPARSDR